MTGPQRVQLRRTKGWRKPEGCIVVSRPSKWGNPFAVGEYVEPDSPLFPYLVHPFENHSMLSGLSKVKILSAERAVETYGWWLIEQPDLMTSLGELTGHDLGCWCALDQPWCHVTVLLELANP